MCTATTYSYASGCSTTVNLPLGTASTSYVVFDHSIPSTAATFSYYPSNTWYSHPSKCTMCGFCPCCGRSNVREEDGPDAGDGRDG